MADKYIDGLKTHCNGQLLLDSGRHTRFLGLQVCIHSTKCLFNSLVVQNNLLSFLPKYKISQDNLELFFCSIRLHGGYNNNPTVRQFMSAYKQLLVHVELCENFRGNCIPLEENSILKCDVVDNLI
ncbi:unnamed protein product [Psylliodes chrysocephalus]|uniref:Transposable element P transposase-like RNase H C-terminal domain-containing protein n=1 Tax=Psylliodes chrysocephalus TaxID=3402493 RepID=A0A9P0GA36_9CUCU|nr:unnamed protein product [Psylliodes chrysocephala]